MELSGQFPVQLLCERIGIQGPMECVVSDMTIFYVKGTYYELTLYMDLWNDELIAHALSLRRGDRMTYLAGLQDVLAFKKQYPEYKLSCTAIKVLSMHPRAITNSCPCTTLQGQCPEPAHQPIMPRWNPSMAGSRPNSLRISISPHRRMSRNRYRITSVSLTKNDRRTHLGTSRQSSIGNSFRPSKNYAAQTTAGDV